MARALFFLGHCAEIEVVNLNLRDNGIQTAQACASLKPEMVGIGHSLGSCASHRGLRQLVVNLSGNPSHPTALSLFLDQRLGPLKWTC